jgi:hypothetical protein
MEDNFAADALVIQHKHLAQTSDSVRDLNAKYSTSKLKIFSEGIGVWDAIQKLGFVHDPTDKQLKAVSQLTHSIQVVDSMLRAGVTDEELLIVAWVHDLGKLLLLTDEDPANVVCLNRVIEGKAGAGLDNCVCSWNHDEYIYLKLRNLLPERSGWLLRYHSLNLKQTEPYLNQKDRWRLQNWLQPFMGHDKLSKSLYNFPKLDWDFHRRLLEKHLTDKLIL